MVPRVAILSHNRASVLLRVFRYAWCETFAALRSGISAQRCGSLAQLRRWSGADNLSAATHKLKDGKGRRAVQRFRWQVRLLDYNNERTEWRRS